MQEVVRTARAGDEPELARMEAAARAAVVGQRGGARHLEEVAPVGDWSGLVNDPRRSIWVALIDTVPVGFLEMEVEGEVATVRQVWVEPEARELGFGDLMLAEALADATRRGCAALEGTALPGDRLTKNLYERAGVVARKIVLSTRLGPAR